MKAWKLFLSEKKNANRFYILLAALAFILFIFLNFLTYNENRRGYLFPDPFFQFFPPKDLSLFIFILTYSLALTGLILAFRRPVLFVQLFGAYAMMTMLRMICLFLIHFDPPEDIIPLNDIFLRSSFYSGRDNLRDLFFSGHTATLFLFVFIFPERRLKIIFTCVAVIVGILLVMQHVHYSIDVLAAPLAAWISVGLTSLLTIAGSEQQ